MNKEKISIVFGADPPKYIVPDYRAMKPIHFFKTDSDGNIEGSMILQNIDQTKLKKKNISFYTPNNIGMLLSIGNKFASLAHSIFTDTISNNNVPTHFEDVQEDKKDFLKRNSSVFYDYFESIQTSLVFGYTALEAFSNISIPDDYLYRVKNESKGLTEEYEKDSIERWIPLKTKIFKILPEIYQTKDPKNEKWSGRFSRLEELRNKIIHQKSIESTDFYKDFVSESIFNILDTPKEILKFFYSVEEKRGKTNPLWPWLINETNHFPSTKEYNSDNFEVIGNLHEGIKK